MANSFVIFDSPPPFVSLVWLMRPIAMGQCTLDLFVRMLFLNFNGTFSFNKIKSKIKI